jgi:hypothetical protein
MSSFLVEGLAGWLAAVVGGGFGVDEKAADFGAIEFEGVFELGNDLVDAGHGEIVGKGAVTIDLDAVGSIVVGAGDEDFVDVEDLGEGPGSAAEADLELAVAFE